MNGTWSGSYDWDDERPNTQPNCSEARNLAIPLHTIITYECPEGFVFETPDLLESEKESNILRLQCSPFASWLPELIPKCIRKILNKCVTQEVLYG